MILRRHWTPSFLLSLSTSLWVQFTLVAVSILLARNLGPAGRGQLAAVLLWPITLAAVGSMGLVEATTHFSAKEDAPVGKILGSVVILGVVQSVVLMALGRIVIHVALKAYGSEILSLGTVALFYIPLFLIPLYLNSVLNGRHQFAAFNFSRGTAALLLLAALAMLGISRHLSIRNAVEAYLFAQAAGGVVAWSALTRVEHPRLEIDVHLIKSMVIFGLQSHLSNVASFLNERLDQLVIATMLGPVALGIYVVSVAVASIVSLPGAASALVALPTVSRLQEGEQSIQASRLLRSSLLLSIGICLPLLIWTRSFLHLTVGDNYLSASGLTRVLALAAIALSCKRVLTEVVRGAGMPRKAAAAETAGLLITLALLPLLLPSLGTMGAAVASLVAYLITVVWLLKLAGAALRVSPGWLLARTASHASPDPGPHE